MYDLLPINLNEPKNKIKAALRSRPMKVFLSALTFALVLLVYLEMFSVGLLHDQVNGLIQNVESHFSATKEEPTVLNISKETKYVSEISYEQAIIDSVASASPSVVSIVISKNVPVYEQQFVNPFGDLPNTGLGSPFTFQVPQQVQKGTQYQEIGAGSGFIVSENGLVLTNKHVVLDKTADYTVFTNDGKKYSAKVLALDPVQDLAIIKIENALKGSGKDQKPALDTTAQKDIKFPSIKIGDSSGIQIGQGAIAIGNALGEFSNTVSVGIVSGLGRTVSASGGQGFSETLEDIIQTDAAINLGNSGGPLINLKGEVIGVNTATANGAQSIGFAIPINIAKRDIDQIIKKSQLQSEQGSSSSNEQMKIVYPFLGVRYILIDQAVKEKYKLSVDSGALILKGDKGEVAITAGSAAEKAGLKEKDIILEVGGEKIVKDNSVAKVIAKHNPGDTVSLKILRDGQEITLEVTLGERS